MTTQGVLCASPGRLFAAQPQVQTRRKRLGDERHRSLHAAGAPIVWTVQLACWHAVSGGGWWQRKRSRLSNTAGAELELKWAAAAAAAAAPAAAAATAAAAAEEAATAVRATTAVATAAAATAVVATVTMACLC